jgi:hypothetical protein
MYFPLFLIIEYTFKIYAYVAYTLYKKYNIEIDSLAPSFRDAINRYYLYLLFQVPDTPAGFLVCGRPRVF